LRAAEGRFRLLVEGITDYAIFMLDSDGNVANWNTGAERIKGYSPTEIIGQHFSRFYLEADRHAGIPERGLSIAARTGKYEAEGWRQRKDGSRFWAHVVIEAIRDESGALEGFAKITRDMTERRAVEGFQQSADGDLWQRRNAAAAVDGHRARSAPAHRHRTPRRRARRGADPATPGLRPAAAAR